MTKIRLIPVVIVSVSALLGLKTIGLVTDGGYVFAGVSEAAAAGGGSSDGGGANRIEDTTITMSGEPTISDSSPTLSDRAPTLETPVPTTDSSIGSADNSIAALNACDPTPMVDGVPAEIGEGGALTVLPSDCPPLVDARAQLLTPGGAVPFDANAAPATANAINDRLTERRGELQTYEEELAMRAALVEAAEKRIEERQQTLQTIENQISALVEQRKSMEEGQFASLVAMYGTMKPKDAAAIFDELDMEVLLRVAKMMTPRKMAPIMAAMNTTRAQELTVRMATDTVDPVELMSETDLAALPQIVGQ